MILAAAIVLVATPPQLVAVSELPRPTIAELQSTAAECRTVVVDHAGSADGLLANGWVLAKLKHDSILASPAKGLMTKGGSAPLIMVEHRRNKSPTCSITGQVDRKQDARVFTAAVATALAAKAPTMLMGTYMFAGPNAIGMLKFMDAEKQQAFTLAIFAIHRGKQ